MLKLRNIAASIVFSTLITGSAMAGVNEDLEFIVTETVTAELFEAALQSQRQLILSAMNNDLQEKGIRVSDLDSFMDIIMEEFVASFTEEMQKRTKDIYLDLFTKSEIQGIAAFYQTAPGQALIQKTPALMTRGADMGREVGRTSVSKLMPRVAHRMEEEGIIIDSPSVTDKLLNAFN